MKIDLLGKKEIDKQLKGMKSAVLKSEIRALNKTARKVRTQAAKQIGQEITLKAAYIKRKLATKKATKNSLYSEINAEKKGILLSRFKSRQLKKKGKNAGISIKVGRKKPRQKIKNAFYIKLKGSNITAIAFRKRGMTGKNDYDVKYAPSVSQVFNNIAKNMLPDVGKWLEKTALHELNFELKKLGL